MITRLTAAAVALGVLGAIAIALGGWSGIAGFGTVLLAIAVLVVLVLRYPAAPCITRPDLPRPALPSPPAATIDRDIMAIQGALRGPRWADVELRPVLARVADTLLQARTGRTLRDDPAAARGVLGEMLFWFVDPARAVRGHDDGDPPSSADLEAMLAKLEEIASA